MRGCWMPLGSCPLYTLSLNPCGLHTSPMAVFVPVGQPFRLDAVTGAWDYEMTMAGR